MAQNDKNRSPQSSSNAGDPNIPLDKDLIKTWMDNQSLELRNQAAEVELRKREMDINARLAEKSLEMQGQHLAGRDGNFRKNVTRLAWIIGGFAILILGTVLTLVLTGNSEFAKYFLQGLSYVVLSGLSFWAGQKIRSKDKDPEPPQDVQTF